MNFHNTNILSEELIHLYLFHVNELYSQLVKCLGVPNLYDRETRRKEKIPSKGNCKDFFIEYAFHGVGCSISTTKIEVDFDFDFDCKLNGFDVWRLWLFVCDSELDGKFDVFKDKVFLEKSFSYLELNGLVKQKDALYYFSNSRKFHSLFHFSNLIQWSGLKTVEDIEQTILPIVNNREEYKEYKSLFENLSESVNNDALENTMLPNELVSSILDILGMVVFYRADSNTLSTISYERDDNALIFWHQWSEHIRENGFESVQDYSYEDERVLKTSDALMRYGYETIEKLYERTNVSL